MVSTIGICFADTLTTISLKIQGTTYRFKYSGFQTLLLFIGEYLNIVVFAIPLLFSKKYRENHFKDLVKTAKATKQELKYTKLWTAIPCLLECLSSGMYFTSLLLMPASVSNMLQGAQIVATCLFSLWINKNPILRHHFLGVSLATLGFFFVGLAGFMGSVAEEVNHDLHYTAQGYFFGLVCIMGNLIFHSIQTNVEEKIMRKYAISPQRVVGLEGLFGIIWMFGLISILTYVPCPNDQLCNMSGYFEDIVSALKEIEAQPGLMFWCGATVVAIFFFNLFGMILIHRVNAVYKVFWDNTMSIFIWATALVLGFETFNKKHFAIQGTGYIFLIIGNLTYSEVLRWHFWGLDKDLHDYSERQSMISQRKASKAASKLQQNQGSTVKPNT